MSEQDELLTETTKIIRKETKVHHRVDGSAITADDVALQILAKAKPIIEKQERERILNWATSLDNQYISLESLGQALEEEA